MTRRTWTPPPTETRQAGRSPAARAAAQPPQQSAGKYAKRFVGSIVIFGFASMLFRSWFPLALGIFLFFTNDEFIEWTLAKAGINLVPNTVGSQFVRSFVFLTCVVLLFGSWKSSLPAWFAPWIPLDASWPQLGAMAVAVAVLTLVSTWARKTLLSRMGIERASSALTLAIDGLVVLAFLGLICAASAIFG